MQTQELAERDRGAEATRIDFAFVAGKVSGELDFQRMKWGVQEHDLSFWFLIVAEEIGEIAKALCERNPPQARTEIIHAIACLAQLHHALEVEDQP